MKKLESGLKCAPPISMWVAGVQIAIQVLYMLLVVVHVLSHVFSLVKENNAPLWALSTDALVIAQQC